MSEFENSLRDALRNDAAPADERFVQRIDAQIKAHEQRRRVGLALAAAAAIALVMVMVVGLGIAVPDLLSLAGRNLPAHPGESLDAVVFGAAVAGLLFLAALAYPLVRMQK
jgi:hypothetical protein